MRKLVESSICILLFFMVACSNPKIEQVQYEDIYSGVEFKMPKVIEPDFPKYTVSILEYNAVSNGLELNTKAINDAINDVAENGGGTVVIPKGIWMTGPIVLQSNVNLCAEEGALVVFSPDKSQYPLIESSFEGLNTVRCQAPIYGLNLENIAITGKGIFDGSGGAWRHVKKDKVSPSKWEELVASGGVVSESKEEWYPSASYKKGVETSDMNVPVKYDNKEDYNDIKDFLRPVMVNLVKCNKVLIDGPVFQNSPAWNIHPLMCENLTVRNIVVRNPWYSQNGDGIDIESCKNSVLYNSSFDVGDDAICIKSGKNKDGRERGMPNENLIVKNCIVYHGHGGVTVGSEMSGGVKNLHVSGCTFIGTDVGLRFKSTRGRGGIVENIYISDISMIDIPTNAISFNMYYGGLSVSEMLSQKSTKEETLVCEITEETPQFKNISIRNISCKGANQAIYLQGLPEMNLKNVSLENIDIKAKKGLTCIDVDGIEINNLNLKVDVKPALEFVNTKNAKITGLILPDFLESSIAIKGKETENFSINMISKVAKENVLILDDTVDENSIELTVN